MSVTIRFIGFVQSFSYGQLDKYNLLFYNQAKSAEREECVLTFQQLIYLVEVSKCGSINKAAENLFISQTGISVSLRALEEEIGIKFFTRSNRGVKFTPEGKQFVSHAAALLEQKKWLENLYHDPIPEESLQTISISSMRFSCFLNIFAERVQRSAGHRFFYTYRDGNIEEVIDDVYDHRADIGLISISNFTEKSVLYLLKSKNLDFHEFIEIKPCALCRAGHPLSTQKTVSEEDIRKYPYIYFDRSLGSALAFSEEIQFNSLKSFPQTICVNSASVSANLVELTDAVALGAGLFLPEVHRKTVAIPLRDAEPLHVGYIVSQNSSLSPEIEEYIQLLRQSVEVTVQKNDLRRRTFQGESNNITASDE